jgi:hypothetical protein
VQRAARLSAVAVLVNVLLGGVLGVIDGVQLVAVRELGVMAGLLVVARFGVGGGFAVMVGRVLVVLGGLVVVVMNLVIAHGFSSKGWDALPGVRAMHFASFK